MTINEEGRIDFERFEDVIYSADNKSTSFPKDNPKHQQRLNGGNRTIKAATFEHLVNCLCRTYVEDDDNIHSSKISKKQFCQIFFETYRTFATPEQLLDKITARIRLVRLDDTTYEKKLVVFRSIEKIIRLWFDKYFMCDFYKPPRRPLIKRYMAGCAHIIKYGAGDGRPVMPEGVKILQDHLKNLIKVLHAAGMADQHGNFVSDIRREDSFEFLQAEQYEVLTDLTKKKKGINPYSNEMFLNPVLSPSIIAEQLSKKDAELLLKLVPHECLQAVRMTKAKPKCLRDTIDQFNRVVYTVFGTCICPSLSTSDRAKVLCKWIEVAECCQQRKNYSSMRAIVSGLRTHALYRLKKTWYQVSNFHTRLLNQLDHVDALEKNGETNHKEVNNNTFLRGNSVTSRTLGKIHKRASLAQLPNTTGTIPYLGSLLTDLTFLNTAFPDYVERKEMINFEKRRKEYDLLLQLQLWQASCKSYQEVKTSDLFESWYNAVYLPDEKETQRLSEILEPTSPAVTSIPSLRTKSPRGPTSPNNKFDMMQRRSTSAPTTPRLPSESVSDECRMLKVVIFRKTSTTLDGSQAYNYVKVESNTRVLDVIQQTLESNPDGGDPESSTLVQLLPNNRDIQFPKGANLYYAMDSSLKEFEFLLLENGAAIPQRQAKPAISSPSLSVPKIRKRSSLSSLRLNFSAPGTSGGKYHVGGDEDSAFLKSKSFSPSSGGKVSPIHFTAGGRFSISPFQGSDIQEDSNIVLKSFAYSYSDEVFTMENGK